MWLIWLIIILICLKLYSTFSSGRCYSDGVLTGKVVIVTGGNSGVGWETCCDFAKRGAKIILTCHNESEGLRAVDKLTREAKTNRIRYEHLDLSSLDSIRKFVKKFKSSEAKLDVLINTASAHCTDTSKTDDGMIRDMQVNYFGPFLLTVLLVPWLAKCYGRVVMLSSYLHRFGTIEGINEDRYGTFQTYANSKLCNVLFTNELSKRLKGTGVTINVADPGIIFTFIPKILGEIPSMILLPFLKTFKEAAQTPLYLAISEDSDRINGGYFVDCGVGSASRIAQDQILGEKLWSISEKLVKLTLKEKDFL